MTLVKLPRGMPTPKAGGRKELNSSVCWGWIRSWCPGPSLQPGHLA